ncbi:MAG: hypothetical protein VX346_27910 [Planctomycetota bacterium]|nr:hypothetical protein [Planctomycetota bacterium]
MTDGPPPGRIPSPCEQYSADVRAYLAAGDYQGADDLLANLGIPAADRAEMLNELDRDA